MAVFLTDLVSFLDDDVAAIRPRDRPVDEQQVVLFVPRTRRTFRSDAGVAASLPFFMRPPPRFAAECTGATHVTVHFLHAVRRRWPAKLCRFMAPLKPRPLETPMTSTALTSARIRP